MRERERERERDRERERETERQRAVTGFVALAGLRLHRLRRRRGRLLLGPPLASRRHPQQLF